MVGVVGCSRFLVVLAGVFSLFCFTANSHADEALSPYRSQLQLKGFYELRSAPAGTQEREIIPTVRITGRLRTEGRIDARFAIRKNKTWKSSLRKQGSETLDHVEPVLLQGKLAVGGGYRVRGKRVMPSAASIIGPELKVTFPGRARGAQKTRQRIYTIRVKLDGSVKVTARVASIPVNAFQRGACAAPTGAATEGNHEPSRTVAALETGEVNTVTRKVLTISTDADPEWYAQNGANSNAEIASIVNAAEVIYERQLGVKFRIVKQHVYTDSSPYSTTAAGELLTTFLQNPDNAQNLGDGSADFDERVDLKHLFTGKNLDGSVIGIAYIGVVCAASPYSYGITQSYMPAANMGIFAHEVGHNLGAMHDISDIQGLMYPSIRVPSADRFSRASLAEMSDHLKNFGSCVSLESVEVAPTPPPQATPEATPQPAPDPTPPSDLVGGALSIRVRAAVVSNIPVVRISGRLQTAAGSPGAGRVVHLMLRGNPVAALATDADGRYQFFVRVAIPRRRSLGLFVQSEGGEVRTRTVRVSQTARRR